MKKTIVLLLTALLVFTGCSGEEPVEYVIYGDVAASAGETASSDSAAGNVEIRAVSSLDVRHAMSQKITNENAPQTRTITVNGVSMELKLKNSEASGLANCKVEAMQEYGKQDIYEAEYNGSTIVAHYRPNGDLLFFSELSAKPNSGALTEDQVKKVALQLLQSLYSKETIAEYTFDHVSFDDNGFTYVYYMKKICGYPTMDLIQIKLHGDGKLKCINALQMGIFSPLEDSITEEKIDAAKKVLMERIGGDWEPKNIKLAVGSDGKCYLRAYGKWNEAAQTAPLYYINID